MQLSIPLDEALAVARASGQVPPFVVGLTSAPDGVDARVDLQRVPDAPAALRWAGGLAGPVDVGLRATGFADGVATFTVTTRARAVPLHVLVNLLAGVVTSVLRARGLGDLVEVRRGDDEPVVAVRLQHAVDERAPGVRVTSLVVRDGTVHLGADITGIRLAALGGGR